MSGFLVCFPEDRFRELVSIDFWKLNKIVTTVFDVNAIFFGGPFKGTFFFFRYDVHIHQAPTCDRQTLKIPNINFIRSTTEALARHTNIYLYHIDNIPSLTFSYSCGLTQDREYSLSQYFLIYTVLHKGNITTDVQNIIRWTQNVYRLFETEILLSLRRLEIHECYKYSKSSVVINFVWYDISVNGKHYVSGDHTNNSPNGIRSRGLSDQRTSSLRPNSSFRIGRVQLQTTLLYCHGPGHHHPWTMNSLAATTQATFPTSNGSCSHRKSQSADEVTREEKLNGHLPRQAEFMYCVHLLVFWMFTMNSFLLKLRRNLLLFYFVQHLFKTDILFYAAVRTDFFLF
jgi:hypothetical protein